MMKLLPLTRRLAAAVAALALVAGFGSNARADVAYAFATQTISAVTVTPGVTLTSAVSNTTQDSATLNGAGISNSNPLDALQAYLGGLPAAPQNFFAPYAPGSPPVSPTVPPSFTRGDAFIASLSGPANSASTVAESYINGPPPNTEQGSGGGLAAFNFTVGTATALTIAYNYANDIFAFTTGTGTATASYGFNITIRTGGTVVFNSTTANTNLSISAPQQAPRNTRSGAEAVITPILAVGTPYTLTFSITSQSSVAVVPEPASMALMGVGGLGALVVARRRRKADA